MTNKYMIYSFSFIILLSAVTGYFHDRTDAREHIERVACIRAHGKWKDVDPSNWSVHYACVFPPHAR